MASRRSRATLDCYRLLAYVVVLAGFAIRLHGLTFQSLWRDEVDSLRFATSGVVTSLAQPAWNGPLYTLMLGRWIAATGRSELALRYSSLLAGVLVLPLLLCLGKRLLGARASVSAAALAAFSPYLVWYSQELKMYALLSLLGLASFVALRAALARGHAWRWALYAMVTSLIPYVHILGVFLIPAEIVAVALGWRIHRDRLRPFAATLATMTLPYVPLAIWQARLLLTAFHTGHPYYPLPPMLASLAHVWTSGVIAGPKWWQLAPFALALLAATVPNQGKSPGARPFLVSWMLLPLALVHVVSLRSPVFTDRYLIASLPAFLLLTAAGVESLLHRWRPLGSAFLALLLLLGAYGIARQSQHSLKADARGAASLIRQGWLNGDAIVLQIPYLSYSLDYYLGPGYPCNEAPYTNDGMTEGEVSLYLRSRLVGKGRAWLLLSEAEMWDARGLTAAWFRGNTRLLQEWHLARVDLYLYELPW